MTRASDGLPCIKGTILDSIDYVPGKGYGVWGYDREIKTVRPATPEDEAAASRARAQVEAGTERMLRGN